MYYSTHFDTRIIRQLVIANTVFKFQYNDRNNMFTVCKRVNADQTVTIQYSKISRFIIIVFIFKILYLCCQQADMFSKCLPNIAYNNYFIVEQTRVNDLFSQGFTILN